MRARTALFVFYAVVMLLLLSSCNIVHKPQVRETIFDKVVSIPKNLVLSIPKLPPLCDEIKDLKKGYANITKGVLYYEEEGRGIPIVLINGGPGGTHHVFHPYFSQLKDVARVIYYDQRGTGKSSTDDTGHMYTVKQVVEDLESLRQALKIDRWAVLGWSCGGLWAQCYALTYPQHCTGLILVASKTGLFEPVMNHKREQMFMSPAELDAIENIGKLANAGRFTSDAQVIYNKWLAGDWKRSFYYKPTDEEMIRHALYGWSPAPGFEKLMRRESDKILLEGKFDDFEIPTLIIEAKWDLQWWNPNRAEVMRRNHPHAQVEVFEKSGHRIFADEPEKFFALLKKFVEKSSKIHIVYKPGNRLTWPKPLAEWLMLYQQAIAHNSEDVELWQQLLWAFYWDERHTEKALEALWRYEMLAKTQAPKELQKYGHCIKVWRGQLLDLLGRRAEAVKCYQEVLRDFKGINDHCCDVDRKWLEERVKTPFKLD
jgi:proline iminopeptidase